MVAGEPLKPAVGRVGVFSQGGERCPAHTERMMMTRNKGLYRCGKSGRWFRLKRSVEKYKRERMRWERWVKC